MSVYITIDCMLTYKLIIKVFSLEDRGDEWKSPTRKVLSCIYICVLFLFKKKRESHGKQQTEHPLPGSHRTCLIPKARGPCNMSPTKSQNCYNSASIIAPPSPPQPRKSIDLSYSSPVLTLHIGHMWSRNFSAWYLKQERTINNWCEIYQRILGFEWTTMTG